MGTQTRYGVCASGDKSLLGKTVICYKRLPNDGIGEIIGIYQVEDTGCSEYVIDIWMPNLEECQEVMNKVYEDGCKGKIWIQVFECKG